MQNREEFSMDLRLPEISNITKEFDEGAKLFATFFYHQSDGFKDFSFKKNEAGIFELVPDKTIDNEMLNDIYNGFPNEKHFLSGVKATGAIEYINKLANFYLKDLKNVQEDNVKVSKHFIFYLNCFFYKHDLSNFAPLALNEKYGKLGRNLYMLNYNPKKNVELDSDEVHTIFLLDYISKNSIKDSKTESFEDSYPLEYNTYYHINFVEKILLSFPKLYDKIRTIMSNNLPTYFELGDVSSMLFDYKNNRTAYNPKVEQEKIEQKIKEEEENRKNSFENSFKKYMSIHYINYDVLMAKYIFLITNGNVDNLENVNKKLYDVVETPLDVFSSAEEYLKFLCDLYKIPEETKNKVYNQFFSSESKDELLAKILLCLEEKLTLNKIVYGYYNTNVKFDNWAIRTVGVYKFPPLEVIIQQNPNIIDIIKKYYENKNYELDTDYYRTLHFIEKISNNNYLDPSVEYECYPNEHFVTGKGPKDISRFLDHEKVETKEKKHR